jgi:hypothetical protein
VTPSVVSKYPHGYSWPWVPEVVYLHFWNLQKLSIHLIHPRQQSLETPT